jgi:uncharacterized protein YecT (DUF1311 family)
MNFRSSRTPVRLLLATVALTLGAYAQGNQKPDDLAFDHREQYTSSFGVCIEKAEALPKFEDVLNAQFPCYESELAIQDRKLNIVYNAVMQLVALQVKQSQDQIDNLKVNERAWIAKRDKTCSAFEKRTRPAAQAHTGHIYDVLLTRDCILQMTARRSSDLNPFEK